MNEAQRSAALVREESQRIDDVNNPRFEAVRVEIAKLDLQPDNVLIVRVPVKSPADGIQRLERGIRAMLGPDARFMIVTDEIVFTVLARSDVPGSDLEDESHA